VPEIRPAFTNQPLAELELRERLATTFTELGLFTNAILELEHAVALADKHLGRKRIQTLENIGRIAWAYQQIPDPVQHLACLTQTWQRAAETFGSSSEIALKSQGQLGVGHGDQGDFSTAIQILDSALAASRLALGNDHPLTYGLMNHLAITLNLAGDPSHGVPLLEETLLWRKRHLGGSALETTRSMLDLATAYLQTGRDAEAIALVAEALRLRRANFGERGAETMLAYEATALAFHTTGHWQLAAEYWDTAQKLRAETMGPNHHLTRLAAQRLIEARTKTAPQAGPRSHGE
jgi:tetratricopeptide (TPR) repeat protein